jgi:hypothetical protein
MASTKQKKEFRSVHNFCGVPLVRVVEKNMKEPARFFVQAKEDEEADFKDVHTEGYTKLGIALDEAPVLCEF